MKMVIDMNLSPEWEQVFQDHHDVQHWSKLGAYDAPDMEILQYAKLTKAVILTNDTDFGSILAATRFLSPSVFLIRSMSLDPKKIGAQVFRCFNEFLPDLETGALISFDLEKSRIRRLPIG
jgi:predicted nuclease of predicted toxin-antitoxin system